MMSKKNLRVTRNGKLKGRSPNVDETLFGEPARLKMMTGNRTWTASTDDPSTLKIGSREKGPTPQRKTVEVISKDLIRTLNVPSTPDPSGNSVIIPTKDFNNLKFRSMVLTNEERKLIEAERKAIRERKMEESNTRKKQMNEYELQRKKNEKPSDLEQESIIKGSELVKNAKLLLDEQDDEIKKLNESILNAKCHAIRDAQLEEKQEIKQAMEDEEKRLDMMMEIERQKAILDYEEKEKLKQIQQLQGAKIIHQQIEEREIQRQLDAEKRDQETQQMLKYMERLQQEDWENLQKKKETQKVLMEEVAKCNEEIKRQKGQVREQEKLEELKILEYIKDKQKREEELQREQEQLKIEKEKEVARLRALQEKAKDKQAERDTLRAKRNQEQFERDWRKKEKEEAQKKADTEAGLRKAREQQIKHRDHFLAVEAQRDRAEFERVLNKQKELMQREEQTQAVAAERRKQHATDIKHQVNEREEELKARRRAFFEEGVKLDQEAQERRMRLNEIKQRKLNELKEAGIPDKYCAEVSRKITAQPASFTAH